ncbi:MAG: ATP synthase subunit I [Actinomycetota bacterium]
MNTGRAMSDPMLTRMDGEAPEQIIATDLAKRSLPFLPIPIIVSALIWGASGAASAAYALALVIGNFLLSGVVLAGAARVSLGLLMGAALFGYLARLGLIFLAVMLVRDQSWVELVPLGITIIVAHLGLLVWEMRHISASLAFPTLKPESAHPTGSAS